MNYFLTKIAYFQKNAHTRDKDYIEKIHTRDKDYITGFSRTSIKC